MTKFNSLSRRESLLGIGAAGTVLGGSALGISSVMAGDDSDDKADDKNAADTDPKTGAFELDLVCFEKGNAKLSVYNETKEAAKVNWTVDNGAHGGVGNGDANGDEQGADEDFDPDGETIEDGEEVDEDDNGDDDNGHDDDGYDNGDDTGYDNGDDAEYGLEGKLTVPEKDSETFWVGTVTKDSTVTVYADGKKVASADVEKLECETKGIAEKLDLEAVCYRTRKDDAGYNGGDTDTNGENGDPNGEEEAADEDFDPDGETIEDGEEVDEDDNGDNGDDDNGHDDDGYDNGEDAADEDDDADKRTIREAKFRVTNDTKHEVKANWTVDGDGQGGKLYPDGKGSESFWVTVLEGQKTYVTIAHDGKEVATEKADTETECTDCNGDY
ncbi:hypothetical protein [Natronorubrum texcoconense]|uniref:Uncharacterized protein n=1 Tax=Natronorubrum texcoconense TaxID=1095776 RepID=A0A1G8TCV5_9EURY|nr:hypothetical protein [Natronorubrum texcoconense]SDJ39341.1 hypothetical protein SAMN04515672_0417 [Natronorubrum texcoconense]